MQIYEFMVTNQKVSDFIFIVHSFACIPCDLGSSIVEYIAVTYATCAFGGFSSKIHLQEFLIISNSWGQKFYCIYDIININ